LKNLLGRLMSRPYEELRAIADAWGTITRDPNPTHNDLAIAVYHTMVEKPSVRGVWSSLDSESHRFIIWLLGQRNMMSILDDVPGHIALDPAEALPLVEQARRIGIVDVDEVLVRGTRVVSSGDNLYSWAPKSQVEAVRRRVVSISAEGAKVLREVIEESKRPAPTDEPFASLLGSLEQEEILRIAATWKLPEAHRYYKQELVGVMSEFIATGRSRDTLLDPLSPPSRGLFEFLAQRGGHSTSTEAKRNFQWEERDLRAALLPLVNRALVWDHLAGDSRLLFVPRDLLATSSVQLPSSLPQPKLSTAAPHAVENRLPYEMPWDLLTILNTAARQELSLTLQENRITKRIAKRINDALIHPGDAHSGTDYIDALIHISQAAGLLAANGREEHPSLHITPRADEWAKLSFTAQRRRLYGFWLEDRKWAEPAAYGTIYWWNCDLTGARKRLTEHIARLPVNEWIGLDAFLRRINMVDPFIIWSQDELVRRFGLRVLQGFRNQWFDIEGRILADMLRTVLCWLGVVEIGRDKQKRFLAFRVTESGIGLLGSPEGDQQSAPRLPQPAIEKCFLVQPNFEVLVINPESRPIWALLKMADLVRHDRVSVYALNKASIMRAIEDGQSDEDLIKLLTRYSDKGLPQNVEQSIHDWSRLIKRVELTTATILEVTDPSVLDELAASRKTKRLIARRLSPTVAIVQSPESAENGHEEPVARVMRELRAAGYFPRVIEEERASDKLVEHKPTRRRSSAKGKGVESRTKSSTSLDGALSDPVGATEAPRKTGTG
jgi:hypothetical protein